MALSDESSGMVLLSGNAHPTLAQLVCERMGVRMGEAVVYNKSNRETSVDIKQVSARPESDLFRACAASTCSSSSRPART